MSGEGNMEQNIIKSKKTVNITLYYFFNKKKNVVELITSDSVYFLKFGLTSINCTFIPNGK